MAKRFIYGLVLSFILVTAAFADLTGSWTATFTTDSDEEKITWNLVADGSKLTGTATSEESGVQPIIEGRIDGNSVSWYQHVKSGDITIRVEYFATIYRGKLNIIRKNPDFEPTEAIAQRIK